MTAATVKSSPLTEVPVSVRQDTPEARATPGHLILHWLALTRIYSWIDVNITGLLGYFAAGGRVDSWMTAAVAVLSTSLWFVLNWYSEKVQKDAGRNAPPWSVVALAALIPLLLVGLLQPVAIGWLASHAAFIWLYPKKKWVAALSWGCWMIRGIHTASFFLLTARLLGPITGHLWQIALGLFFLQAARSLVAEVRDAPYDAFGLPKLLSRTVGERPAWWLCLAISALVTGCAQFYIGPFNVGATEVWTVTLFSVCACVHIIVHLRDLPVAAYYLHRDLLSVSVAVKCLADAQPQAWGIPPLQAMLVFSALSIAIAAFTYDRVRRPINDRVMAGKASRSSFRATAAHP